MLQTPELDVCVWCIRCRLCQITLAFCSISMRYFEFSSRFSKQIHKRVLIFFSSADYSFFKPRLCVFVCLYESVNRGVGSRNCWT